MTQTLLILLILYQVSQRVRPHQGTHLLLSGNLIPDISEELVDVGFPGDGLTQLCCYSRHLPWLPSLRFLCLYGVRPFTDQRGGKP